MQRSFIKHNVIEMDFLSRKRSLYAAGMLPYLGQFRYVQIAAQHIFMKSSTVTKVLHLVVS